MAVYRFKLSGELTPDLVTPQLRLLVDDALEHLGITSTDGGALLFELSCQFVIPPRERRK